MPLTVLFNIAFTRLSSSFFFFFNDTATTEIYTLSLHDALPILVGIIALGLIFGLTPATARKGFSGHMFFLDRKSTRLNSSHSQISYAVFCLKKKKKVVLDSPLDASTHLRCV